MSNRLSFNRLLMQKAVAGALSAAACCATRAGAAEIALPPAAVENRKTLVAGPRQAIVGGIDPDNLNGNDPTDGVFVRDSQAAVDKLALARKMERLKEWNKSADLYQEVLEKYRDRVVPSARDKEGKVTQYTSITLPVQEQLAKWPQEGLDVYRARYETPATAQLEGAKPDDLNTLTNVYDRFFVTDAGKLAGIRLIDLYLERGEYRAAADVGDRLLQWHPNLLAERASILFRTAMALHLAGDMPAAKVRLAQLAKDFPAERGTVRGKDVLLADALSAELGAPTSADETLEADSWPMFGGSPDRARVAHSDGRMGARLFSIPLAKPAWGNINAQQRAALEGAVKAAADTGGTLGIMPIVEGGNLYYQDGVHVCAVNLENGLPLSGWVQTYGGNGQYTLPGALAGAHTRQLTLTATDNALLAIMGQPDRIGLLQQIRPDAEARLVCLNRETGKELWTTALSQLPEEAAAQRTLQLSGSPLVVGDNVMVVGRAGKQAQFEDCYVLCFNLANGKFRWASYIASANTAGPMLGMMQTLGSENVTHLAYANGRVYVQTNLGALACLDAFSGTIIWLDIYPHMQVANGGFMGGMPGMPNQQPQAQRRPWAFNPVMVVDGRVFSLPIDGREGRGVLIYDAATGAPIKDISMEQVIGSDEQRECDTLLGVVGDNLYVSGQKTTVCINWRTYDPDKFDDDSYIWKEPLPKPLRGRGFLTTDSLFLPTEESVYQIDRLQSAVIATYPGRDEKGGLKSWDDGEEPGNVLVAGDHVVIATANSIDVYTDLGTQLKKLDREIAQSPGDPQPRLRYAEVLFVAGQQDAAIAKLDEAAGLLGGIGAMQSGPGRDRVFGDALSFANKSSSGTGADDKRRTAALFERASSAAATPAQQIQYRLQRAKFAEASKDLATAVKLYQEILSNPQLRSSPLTDEASGLPAPAETIAERAITRATRLDRTVYAPIEREAAKALEQARTARDNPAAQLLEVAQTYPNSTVAAPAMLEAADAFESAGNARLAIQALRQLYFKDTQGTYKTRVLESMARNYLSLPNRADVAAARLAQGAALQEDAHLTRPLRLPDGRILQNVTFTQALDELRHYSAAQAARSLPDLRIPIPPLVKSGERRHALPAFLPQGPADVVPDIKTLLTPSRDFTRSDRLVAWSTGGKLLIFPAGKTTPLASVGGFTDDPIGCAWLGGNLLAWSNNEVMLLGGDSAQPLWTLAVSQMPALAAAHGNDAAAQVAPVAIARPAIGVGNGPFGNVMIRRGGMRVINPMPAPPPAVNVVAKPANGPEQIADVRPVGDRVLIWTSWGRLLSADLINGKIAWQMRLNDRPIDRIVANEDFTVARVSDEGSVRLVALDTFTGHVLGSKAFVVQSGMVPINLALADDGTLVYTLPDRLCLKNLYTSWPDSSDREVTGPPGPPLFSGASQPDHLQIAEGRILALADNGNEKYVRVHSLETGNPVPLKFVSPQGNQEIDRVLSAGRSWSCSMRVVGSQLYVYCPQGLYSYNLDNPSLAWSVLADSSDAWNPRELFIGQHFLGLVLDQTPTAAGGAPAQPTFSFQAYGRYPKAPGAAEESGRVDYIVPLTDPAAITGPWQAVDGGVCYLTADNKLHLLRGSQQEGGAAPVSK